MNNYAVFILTYGRPQKVVTIKTLRDSGYKGKIYLVCSTDDNMLSEYKKTYPDVIIFNKEDYKSTFDICDNFEKDNVVVYARNACFDIAKNLGYKYFLVLDDDYVEFRYKFNHNKEVCDKKIKNINNLFSVCFDYYEKSNAITMSLSQTGDFLGGAISTSLNKIKIKRKAMNSFFCCIDRPFKYLGRINEDVNMYVFYGQQGKLIFQINNLCLMQLQTQSNTGGLTEFYLDTGTYIKSFYTVIIAPNITHVYLMGNINKRLHHQINWKCAIPKIISESLRK